MPNCNYFADLRDEIALAVVGGLQTDGRWLVDGGCTKTTACQKKMLIYTRTPDRSRHFPGITAAGEIKEVTAIGPAKITLSHGRSTAPIFEAELAEVRLIPQFGVNLIAERDLVEKLGCSLSWSPDGKGKVIRFPNGKGGSLVTSGGLHFLELDPDLPALSTTHDADMRVSSEEPVFAISEAFTNIDSAIRIHQRPQDDQTITTRLGALHQLLGHIDGRSMLEFIDEQGWTISDKERAWLAQRRKFQCNDDSCACGKHVRKSVPKNSLSNPVTGLGQKVSCDVVGKITDSTQGERYAWLFMDWNSKMVFVYPCHSKSDYLQCFHKFLRGGGYVKDGKVSLLILQSDTSPEVFSGESQKLYDKHFILARASPPGEQGKNSMIERAWRYLKSKLITVMWSVRAPHKFWAPCLKHMALQAALTPRGRGETRFIPWKAQFQETPDVAKLLPCPWGSVVSATRWVKQTALDPPGRIGTFIGNSIRSQSSAVYCHDTKRVIEAYSMRPLLNDDGLWRTAADARHKMWDLPSADHYYVKEAAPAEGDVEISISAQPSASVVVRDPGGKLDSVDNGMPRWSLGLYDAESQRDQDRGTKSTVTTPFAPAKSAKSGKSALTNDFRPDPAPHGAPSAPVAASIDPVLSADLQKVRSAPPHMSYKIMTHGELKELHRRIDAPTPKGRSSKELRAAVAIGVDNIERMRLHRSLVAGEEATEAAYRRAVEAVRTQGLAATGDAADNTDHHSRPATPTALTPPGSENTTWQCKPPTKGRWSRSNSPMETTINIDDIRISNQISEELGDKTVAGKLVQHRLGAEFADQTRPGSDGAAVPTEVTKLVADDHEPATLPIEYEHMLLGFEEPLSAVQRDCKERDLSDPAFFMSTELNEIAKTERAFLFTQLARSLTEAKKLDSWEPHLRQAHEKEMRKFVENDVFEMVPWDSTVDPKTIVDSFINYTSVHGPDGSIAKWKARFLAKGFSQKEFYSFFDTASPTPFDTSWRMLMQIACMEQWPIIKHDDVVTAFLTAEMEEKVHLRFPKDMRERDSSNRELLGRLKKSVYGLRQSSRNFSDKMARTLQNGGYTRSKLDTCVYYKRKGADILVSVLFVDDALTFSTSKEMYDDFRACLLKEFELEGGHDAAWYLNMEIKRDNAKGEIRVGQKALALSLAERFPFLRKSLPVSTPLPEKTQFSLEQSPSPTERDKELQENFRSGVGVLLYLALKTRMDLQQAVSMATRVMSNPGKAHMASLEHLLRYTYHTAGRELVFRKGIYRRGDPLKLVAYCDSDWGGEKPGRRSTSGYIVELNGCLIDYRSKLQSTIARSSCHAELVATSLCAAAVVHMRNFMAELGYKLDGPTSVIMVDNQAAIATGNSPVTTARLRHLELADLWVREMVMRKKVWLHYIRTEDNPSDCLTKPLGKTAFKKHVGNYYDKV